VKLLQPSARTFARPQGGAVDEDVPLWKPSSPRHGPVAQLLIAWAPLTVLLAAYAVAGWVSAPIDVGSADAHNRLGFSVQVAAPASADSRLFGAVPSVWLQEQLAAGPAQWYDVLSTLVYLTHFVTIPVMTALVWFRLRDRFTSWLVTLLGFTVLGIGGYIAYPAAPPWMASDQGVIGSVDRISDRGLEYLHLPALASLFSSGQAGSNPVAAMPSLHAGSALLVALVLWPVVSRTWRAVLIAYAVAMALTLVYTGEHYVVDVVAGWCTAGLAVVVGAVVHRRRQRRDGRRAWG